MVNDSKDDDGFEDQGWCLRCFFYVMPNGGFELLNALDVHLLIHVYLVFPGSGR